MAEWDLTELIADVRARGSIPDDDANFTDAEIRKAATLELREKVAPLLVRCRTDHLVYRHEQPITAGTSAYRMPTRAMAGSLRDVIVVDSGGNVRPPLVAISSDDPRAQAGVSGEPFAYYVRNHHVVLVDVPSSGGTLRLPYYARPNKLAEVNSTTGGTITSVSYANGNVDLRTVINLGSISNGATFAAAATGKPLDFIDRRSPFETIASDLTPDSVVDIGTGLVRVQHPVSSFDAIPAVGDYVYLAGSAPVPQVPAECHGLLAARTALRLLKSAGDDRWQALREDVTELEANAITLISSRVASGVEQPGGLLWNSPLLT